MAGKEAARWAVKEQLSERGWNNADLAKAAGIDPGTASDFLAGTRWPKPRTLGKIEAALGWPYGALSRMADGIPPEVVLADLVGGDSHDDAARISLDLGDVTDGLSAIEIEEVTTAARLAALEKARQIRGG